MRELVPTRGRVYATDLGYGRKPWLVVSNNARNAHLATCLALRITTTPNVRERPTVVVLGSGDPLVGRVLCDDLEQIGCDDFVGDLGALTPSTMIAVAGGLRAALAL